MVDSILCDYFTAVAFLHVGHKTTRNGLSDEYVEVLALLLEQMVGKRRYSHKLNSVSSLSQGPSWWKS